LIWDAVGEWKLSSIDCDVGLSAAEHTDCSENIPNVAVQRVDTVITDSDIVESSDDMETTVIDLEAVDKRCDDIPECVELENDASETPISYCASGLPIPGDKMCKISQFEANNTKTRSTSKMNKYICCKRRSSDDNVRITRSMGDVRLFPNVQPSVLERKRRRKITRVETGNQSEF